jgi:hypothetical protein
MLADPMSRARIRARITDIETRARRWSAVESHVALRTHEIKEMSEGHTVATVKVRVWGNRAVKARSEGRKADADRCDDKVRDWVSRARQIERIQSSEKEQFQVRALLSMPAVFRRWEGRWHR